MKKIIFLFFGIFFFPYFGFCAIAQDDEYTYFRFPEEDLYMTIYKKSDEIEEKALKNMEMLLNISPVVAPSALAGETRSTVKEMVTTPISEIIQRILKNNETVQDLNIICKSSSILVDYYQCKEKIQKTYAQEIKILQQEYRLHWESLSESVWANGTLEDGSFDVLVDLNIIDTIFFGRNAKISGGPNPFLFDENSVSGVLPPGSTSYSASKNVQYGSLNNNANGTNTDTKTENTNKKDPSNKNTQDPAQMCIDPEALFVKKPSDSGSSGSDNTKNGNESENNNTREAELQRQRLLGNFSGSRTRNYLNTSAFPENTEDTCTGEQVALFGKRVCIDLRCDDIICIHITLIPGYRKVQMQDNDCIECSIHKGLNVLQPLSGLSGKLSPNDAPTEPWFLTAFANLFRNAGGKFVWIWKPLPFLVYDNPQQNEGPKSVITPKSSTSSTNSNKTTSSTSSSSVQATTPESKTPKKETKKKTKEERIAELDSMNQVLFRLQDSEYDNCDLILSKLPPGIENISSVFQACQDDSDQRKLQAEGKFLTTSNNYTTRTAGEETTKQESYTQFFQDVVKNHLSSMGNEISAMNSLYGTIDTEAMEASEEKCATKAN